jgi:hypothetical protein
LGGRSEFDPPGGQCDPDRRESAAEPTGVYEGLSTWDFRPPHPIGPGTVINEMVFESGL